MKLDLFSSSRILEVWSLNLITSVSVHRNDVPKLLSMMIVAILPPPIMFFIGALFLMMLYTVRSQIHLTLFSVRILINKTPIITKRFCILSKYVIIFEPIYFYKSTDFLQGRT